jgi:ubiquinone/menaquinone biosynthesis C-methylase UbiE
MSKATGKAVSQEKVSEDFDRYVESYGQQIDDAVGFSGLKQDFFVKAKCEYLTRLTARHLGDNSKRDVLDLGCGIASYHSVLATAYKSLSGIDVSEKSVDYARKQNPGVAYSVYPGGRLPYDDASFDAIFAMCVMHHVPVQDWPVFVFEMKRVLKPGGLGMVFEHNPANPITRKITSDCPIDEDAVLLPTARTRGLFRDAGFKSIKSRSILSIPPLVKPLYPIDEMLGRIGLGAQYYVIGRKVV